MPRTQKGCTSLTITVVISYCQRETAADRKEPNLGAKNLSGTGGLDTSSFTCYCLTLTWYMASVTQYLIKMEKVMVTDAQSLGNKKSRR